MKMVVQFSSEKECARNFVSLSTIQLSGRNLTEEMNKKIRRGLCHLFLFNSSFSLSLFLFLSLLFPFLFFFPPGAPAYRTPWGQIFEGKIRTQRGDVCL
jgi:hypothetical protein